MCLNKVSNELVKVKFGHSVVFTLLDKSAIEREWTGSDGISRSCPLELPGIAPNQTAPDGKGRTSSEINLTTTSQASEGQRLVLNGSRSKRIFEIIFNAMSYFRSLKLFFSKVSFHLWSYWLYLSVRSYFSSTNSLTLHGFFFTTLE